MNPAAEALQQEITGKIKSRKAIAAFRDFASASSEQHCGGERRYYYVRDPYAVKEHDSRREHYEDDSGAQQAGDGVLSLRVPGNIRENRGEEGKDRPTIDKYEGIDAAEQLGRCIVSGKHPGAENKHVYRRAFGACGVDGDYGTNEYPYRELREDVAEIGCINVEQLYRCAGGKPGRGQRCGGGKPAARRNGFQRRPDIAQHTQPQRRSGYIPASVMARIAATTPGLSSR